MIRFIKYIIRTNILNVHRFLRWARLINSGTTSGRCWDMDDIHKWGEELKEGLNRI